MISKKTEETFTIAPQIKEIFKEIYREQNKPEDKDDEVPKIKVSDLVSKMAFYYEKIRNSVDYKEENLLRKNAIERILKRHIIIEGAITERRSGSEEMSAHLLTELIRAGYLQNNKIPEEKIGELSIILDKYIELRKIVMEKLKNEGMKVKNEYTSWIISLAATDIESKLETKPVDDVIVEYMYEILTENIILPENSPFEKDKDIQIFVGIHRNYLKFDREMLSFVLLKYFHPEWEDGGIDEVRTIADKVKTLREDIDAQIDHPLAAQLNRLISRYTVFFTILKDVIEEDPQGMYKKFRYEPKVFSKKVKQMAEKRYQIVKTKLWRAAFRSIVYIFITKSIFAFLLEVPAIQFFDEEINPVSLIINITFPAALLFLIILFSRLPSDDNTAKVTEGIQEIVFEENKRTEPFRLRKPAKRGKSLNSVFGIIYIITFFLSFGAVVWILDKIHFSFISTTIFLFFLALVSFFSNRIRKNAKELIILEPRESLFSFVADFFYVPIVSAGKWLSDKFSQVNVFVFILDFIIEAPFKIFVSITEEWTKYVRERKDEIG